MIKRLNSRNNNSTLFYLKGFHDSLISCRQSAINMLFKQAKVFFLTDFTLFATGIQISGIRTFVLTLQVKYSKGSSLVCPQCVRPRKQIKILYLLAYKVYVRPFPKDGLHFLTYTWLTSKHFPPKKN